MVEYTPGPWFVGPYYKTDIESKNGRIAQAIPFGTPLGEANAKLIAAAPDLLKELQHLVRLLEPLEAFGELEVPGLATLNGARAAISKALGN